MSTCHRLSAPLGSKLLVRVECTALTNVLLDINFRGSTLKYLLYSSLLLLKRFGKNSKDSISLNFYIA